MPRFTNTRFINMIMNMVFGSSNQPNTTQVLAVDNDYYTGAAVRTESFNNTCSVSDEILEIKDRYPDIISEIREIFDDGENGMKKKLGVEYFLTDYDRPTMLTVDGQEGGYYITQEWINELDSSLMPDRNSLRLNRDQALSMLNDLRKKIEIIGLIAQIKDLFGNAQGSQRYGNIRYRRCEDEEYQGIISIIGSRYNYHLSDNEIKAMPNILAPKTMQPYVLERDQIHKILDILRDEMGFSSSDDEGYRDSPHPDTEAFSINQLGNNLSTQMIY